MQIINILIIFHKSLNLLEPVLQIVGFIDLRPQNQEIFFILITMIVITGCNDDNTTGILIHLDCMFLVVVVFQVAVLAHVHGETFVDAKFGQDYLCYLGLQGGVEDEGYFGHTAQPEYELLDPSDREHGLIVIPEPKYLPPESLIPGVASLHIEGQVAGDILIPILDDKIAYLNSDDYLSLLYVSDAVIVLAFTFPGLLQPIVSVRDEHSY